MSPDEAAPAPETVDPRQVEVLRERIRTLEDEYNELADRRTEVHDEEIPVDLAPRFSGDAGVIFGGSGEEPVTFDLEDFRVGSRADLSEKAALSAEVALDTGREAVSVVLDEVAVEAELGHVFQLVVGKFYNPVTWWGVHLPKGSYGFTPISMPLAPAP